MKAEEEFHVLKEIKKNPEKFEIVYDAYFNRIFAYVFKRTLDYNIAKDICSEIFIKAFLGIKKYKWQNTPLIVWLFKIAQNEIRLYFRSKKYRPEYLSSDFSQFRNQISPDVEEERINAENQLLQKSSVRKLIENINRLPDNEKETISLKYIENLTYDEIAQVLQMKTGTVKSHISRGLKKLRKWQPMKN